MEKYKFELCQIDPYNCSIEELEKEIKKLENKRDEYDGIQNSIKIYINSIYGALGSRFFPYYNVACAEAITLQGQSVIKFTNQIIEDYFYNQWHLDKEIHTKLGLTYVNRINPTTKICIYNDTDSVAFDSLINTDKGVFKIEDWYNNNIKNGSNGETLAGHESVKTDDKILNWSSNENLYYANVKRIIRHKVNKKKWVLKTKSGKEIIVTNDHSLIVFRDNKKIEIKPEQIIKGDKVISVR